MGACRKKRAQPASGTLSWMTPSETLLRLCLGGFGKIFAKQRLLLAFVRFHGPIFETEKPFENVCTTRGLPCRFRSTGTGAPKMPGNSSNQGHYTSSAGEMVWLMLRRESKLGFQLPLQTLDGTVGLRKSGSCCARWCKTIGGCPLALLRASGTLQPCKAEMGAHLLLQSKPKTPSPRT